MGTEAITSDKRWQFDRHLNIGHLLTTLLIAGGAVAVWSQQNERIAVIEERLASSITAQIQSRNILTEDLREIKSDVKSVQQLLFERYGTK